MTPEVNEMLGRSLNHKRIGRLMREQGLCSRKRRPFRVVTTDSRHDHPIAPNALERDFAATISRFQVDSLHLPREDPTSFVTSRPIRISGIRIRALSSEVYRASD